MIGLRKAIFLDKDGTLIENVPYNVDPSLIRLTPNAAEGLVRLSNAGYGLFVVTNQTGIARGYFPESALQGVEARLREALGAFGINLQGFFYCPHLPGDQSGFECDCHKPQPGMLLRAARQYGLALEDSWLIGDILNDVEAGYRAGCRTVLIDTGEVIDWPSVSSACVPTVIAQDLADAARMIIDAELTSRTNDRALGGGSG
jgi:D-glycero-D-manno-heptose 1,7-bisphosphate phosphatase